jgi:CO/xanthine dehydrogenase FAD-binding subunit
VKAGQQIDTLVGNGQRRAFTPRCGAEAGWYILNRRETRPTEILVDVEAPMSSGRHFSIRSFVGSVVAVAVAAASVYLSYELVVKPRRALQDQIRE